MTIQWVAKMAGLAKACVCVAGVIGLMGLAGCQSAQIAEPLTANPDQIGNEPEAQMEFWHTLATRPLTSNDEAFHALLLFLDDGDAAENYEQRVERLKSYDLLSAGFDRPANEAITRGVLAVALVRALHIRGGVMLSLFDHSARYATMELQHLGIYPRSSPHQTFTGNQFIAMIGLAEDYQTRGGQDASRQAVWSQDSHEHAHEDAHENSHEEVDAHADTDEQAMTDVAPDETDKSGGDLFDSSESSESSESGDDGDADAMTETMDK